MTRTVEFDDIIDFFCDRKGVCKDSLFGDSIKTVDCATRYMIWHYFHCELKISIGRIARKFNRSRNTVFRGVRMMRNHIRLYKNIRAEYEGLVNELKGMPD